MILDEFQRFKHVLDGDDDAARLARAALRPTRTRPPAVRLLLLSATPYKMYTLHHEERRGRPLPRLPADRRVP